MNLIAAVDKNWAIGKAGRELVNIPEDKKFFREETTGKVIVMGRKTFESLPGAMALAGRTNIVLSENPGFAPKIQSYAGHLKKQKKNWQSIRQRIFISSAGAVFTSSFCRCVIRHTLQR